MPLIHDFDQFIDRRGTDSKKYSTEYYSADVLPMWIADTDFKAPQPIIDAIQKRAEHGVFGYTVPSQRLKKAVKFWEETQFGYHIKEDDVEYVPGVISGIICAIRALTRPGDGVILQTPAYPPFSAAIENNGRQILRNPLVLENGKYHVDFLQFEALCQRSRSRIFILCNPQNPTGRVWSEEELQRMGEICLRNHVTVISDEIHCDLTYPGHSHLPFSKISPAFALNCISFINPSKTFNIAGLRTAAMICENSLLRERIHEVLLSNKAIGENIFGTLALCVAYENCAYYAAQLKEYLVKNLAYVHQQLRDIPCMKLIEPEGTFLLWIDCREMELTQPELMRMFVEEAKVGVESGTDFGDDGMGFVRLNIGCPRATLEEAFRRIKGGQLFLKASKKSAAIFN